MILVEKFFEILHSKKPEEFNVSIISVDGLSFKRYLEIAKGFESKNVAVITDNDKDYDANITKNYSDYNECNNIKVFSDQNNANYTFEVCVYNDNKSLIDEEKLTTSSDVLRFMLNKKAEFALRLLEMLDSPDKLEVFIIPQYIEEAVKWVIRN